MSGQRTISTIDLTIEEQEHVRSALHYLRLRFGGWSPLARVLHFEETTLVHVGKGRRGVSAPMAFRIARLVKVKIDDLLAGGFPAVGVCPRCGYDPKARAR
jgi:hypothetical protein